MTFGAFWVAAVDFVAEAAPEGWGTTFQAILATMVHAAGPGVGALVGGFVWKTWSPIVMYQSFAYLIGTLGLLLALQTPFTVRWSFNR